VGWIDWPDDLVDVGWVVAREPQLKVGVHISYALDDQTPPLSRVAGHDDVCWHEHRLSPIYEQPVASAQARLHRMAADRDSREPAARNDDHPSKENRRPEP